MTRTVTKAASWLLSSSLAALAVPAAYAADQSATQLAQTTPAAPAAPAAPTTDQAAPAAAPAAPAAWVDGIKFGLQVEGGIIVNPDRPNNGLNFGQLFTDRANQVALNQILVGVQRPIDPKSTDYDFGFALQGLYGTDARYAQPLGIANYAIANRYQFGLIQANLQAHLPWLTDGGIDVKGGIYPTPLGFETIDPSTNPFYSHSYIFNYGLPLLHTGVLGIWHANSFLDIYGGVDSGVNTTLKGGDNNQAAGGTFGFGLTLLDGNLTVLALTHFGPENGTALFQTFDPTVNANGYYRWLNDITITYKASDTLSFTTELNLIRDDYFKANGFGVAQYASYALSDTVALNARGEIWRDDNGFYVSSYSGVHDFVNAEYGFPAPGAQFAKASTYSEVTLGMTFKPSIPYVTTFLIRPEIRYDYALTNTHPFNNLRDRGVFTVGADVVVGF